MAEGRDRPPWALGYWNLPLKTDLRIGILGSYFQGRRRITRQSPSRRCERPAINFHQRKSSSREPCGGGAGARAPCSSRLLRGAQLRLDLVQQLLDLAAFEPGDVV